MASGGVGLLHVAGADPGRSGMLRFAGLGEYFSSADCPVLGAQNTRTAGTFALAYVPLDFLEVSLAYTASANTNSRSTPNLIQALGDVTLGARASRQWSRDHRLALGLAVEAPLPMLPEPRQKLVTREGDTLELRQQVSFAEGKAPHPSRPGAEPARGDCHPGAVMPEGRVTR